MIGAAALVPPMPTRQSPFQKPLTPVAGSATAETSDCVRCDPHPESSCQAGLASKEQPLPGPPKALPQADSVQPRALESLLRLVPPTAITYDEAAGYATLGTAPPAQS